MRIHDEDAATDVARQVGGSHALQPAWQRATPSTWETSRCGALCNFSRLRIASTATSCRSIVQHMIQRYSWTALLSSRIQSPRRNQPTMSVVVIGGRLKRAWGSDSARDATDSRCQPRCFGPDEWLEEEDVSYFLQPLRLPCSFRLSSVKLVAGTSCRRR